MEPIINQLALTVTNCTTNCDTNLPQISASTDTVQNALRLAFGIIGTIAVIMIVISGIRYVLSQGDPQTVAKARQSIIYALIGLVVALSAELIVTFVLGKV